MGVEPKDDACRYLEKSNQFYESISDLKGVADTLFALAIATGFEGHMKKAHLLYERLNLVRESNVFKQHFAFHVEAKTDYQKAVEELKSIAETFVNVDDLGMTVYTLARAVIVCLANDDVDRAKTCLQRATECREKMVEDNPYMLGFYYRAKSELHFCLGNLDQCINDSEKSSELCAIMGMYSDSADALQVGAKAYQMQGNFETANEVLNRVVDLLRKSQRRNEG